jgi:hypothetical protein
MPLTARSGAAPLALLHWAGPSGFAAIAKGRRKPVGPADHSAASLALAGSTESFNRNAFMTRSKVSRFGFPSALRDL